MPLVHRKLKERKPSRIYQSQQGWHEIDGRRIYFRSRWELRYAKFLQFLKEQKTIQDWLHEPRTFWFEEIKRGVRSYLPDFKVINPDTTHYWVEVKGYMDKKSQTKLKRFNKYYPEEKIIVIDQEWFAKNGEKIKWIKE